MKFKITREEPEYKPYTISITCENIEELLEMQCRMEISKMKLYKTLFNEGYNKESGPKGSRLNGITNLRRSISNILGKNSNFKNCHR
ncbi:MAG: hypothetical protein GQ540_03190 [Lutibacter sp.]|uniref:hypothetical protein n=1 Tax=Lutibacter sp. TaxID=1925666 RepID=UPI0019FBD8FC|nr:hypothetical protein [Lutibacter sp.]NOR27516.1 hypothetical protein [Lutibacter sp.]